MVLLALDWATISSLATGLGTLVLAIATFAAVRSSNRSARIAEAALQEQRRPLLASSRLEDPKQKIMFVEGHWVSAAGGRAAVEHIDGVVFLAISLRNVGSGIAVLQGWVVREGPRFSGTYPTHVPLEDFRRQTRDLYIPAGDIGMWQGALRDPDDPVRAEVAEAIDAGRQLTVELLYSDQVGRQRTISRFGLTPAGDVWLASLNRHWYLDWEGPRPENLTMAAAELLMREREAAERRRAADGPADAGEDAHGNTGAGSADDTEDGSARDTDTHTDTDAGSTDGGLGRSEAETAGSAGG
jgi:hypothetical protein